MVPGCGVAQLRWVLGAEYSSHHPRGVESADLQPQFFSEEERTRFRDLLASPTYRASPLQTIGQQLARQLQLDGGGLL